MRVTRWLAAAWLWASSVALAQEPAPEEEIFDEVVVWGDLFARWDDTRWFVETEIALPYAMVLRRDETLEFRSTAMQVRAVIRCNKQGMETKRRMQVDCVLEDFGIQTLPFRNDRSKKKLQDAQLVLDEIDAKLTGASLQLQVAEDGRVTNVDLEGVPKTNERIANIHETLRQVLSRVVVGFDMKLRKGNQLNEGKWIEYNSALMTMPVPAEVTGTSGSSMLVHYLNRYQGHVLVQSIGKGLISLPRFASADGVESDLNMQCKFIGVSIFDADEGYMTERVWSLNGEATASAIFSTNAYTHAGRIRLLGEKDAPDVGPTRPVKAPNESTEGLADWVPIES